MKNDENQNIIILLISFLLLIVSLPFILVKKIKEKKRQEHMITQSKKQKQNKFSEIAPITTRQIASNLNQQEGFAFIEGEGKVHFWLYKISQNENNMPVAAFFLRNYLPKWIENLGYVIDFENIKMIKPNNEVPASIKGLLQLRGYNVAISVYSLCVHIDAYDKNEDLWWSGLIPLIE